MAFSQSLLVIGLTTFAISTGAAADTPPRLLRSVWSCSAPCETADGTHTPLKAVQFGWCGTTALNLAMIKDVAVLCQRRNATRNARAARRQTTIPMSAKCDSSANPCEHEGPIPVGWTCLVECPSDPLALKFSACAVTSAEAWSLAESVCRGARRPEILAESKICEANAETECGKE